MGFLVNKITGNGTTQIAITNDATLEAVVNSLVAYNTTESGLNFTVSINGSVIFSESVSANSTYRLPDKINLGAISTLEVNAPIGLNVTVSYLQQAIDVVGALNAAQVLAQQASDDADRAAAIVGALPVGTLDDSTATVNTAWSSKKIADELDTKQDTLTFDTVPTKGSTNPVESSGVFDALATKLPLSGGTMTGAITAIRETQISLGVSSAIDLSLGNVFTKSVNSDTTFSVLNCLSSGTSNSFILELVNAGSFTITWFSGIKWAEGIAPVLTASGVDILGFYSYDGGVTWKGLVLGNDMK